MTRIIATAALLAATTAIVPTAHAGLASSSMVADLTYSGDLNNLSISFELVDNRTGELAWSLPATVQADRSGNVSVTADLGRADWAMDDSYSWCVVVDATRATSRLELSSLYHQVDADDDLASGRGGNVAGGVSELCVTGSRF